MIQILNVEVHFYFVIGFHLFYVVFLPENIEMTMSSERGRQPFPGSLLNMDAHCIRNTKDCVNSARL